MCHSQTDFPLNPIVFIKNAILYIRAGFCVFDSLVYVLSTFSGSYHSLLNPVTYRFRSSITPHLPERIKTFFPSLRHYTPLPTFADQISAGITSTNFDIEANLRDGDSRTGLDEQGTQEVLEIMRRQRVKYIFFFVQTSFF